MESKICAVCKKPIDDSLVVKTHLGDVHPGDCLSFVEDLPVSESDAEQALYEVELLM